MAESIHAFSLPLGPAQPGLTEEQIAKRKNEARRIVRATMPSAKALMNCVLEERIISAQGLLWLAFDLAETPQLQLLATSAKHGRKRLVSTLNGLYCELERLKAEADATVIRVGELAAFAATLSTLSGAMVSNAVEELSNDELELWRIVHSRKGKHIEVAFSTGNSCITMPLFPQHIADKHLREIRFKVNSLTRTKAMLGETETVDAYIANGKILAELPRSIQLVRPHGDCRSARDTWFLLYIAEYCDMVVEATVRMARNVSDLSPSHLELIEIANAEILKAAMKDIRFS